MWTKETQPLQTNILIFNLVHEAAYIMSAALKLKWNKRLPAEKCYVNVILFDKEVMFLKPISMLHFLTNSQKIRVLEIEKSTCKKQYCPLYNLVLPFALPRPFFISNLPSALKNVKS